MCVGVGTNSPYRQVACKCHGVLGLHRVVCYGVVLRGIARRLDADDPFYDVFSMRSLFGMQAHNEAHFCTSKIQPERVEICCHCVGEFDFPVEFHSSFKAPDGLYSVVVLLC